MTTTTFAPRSPLGQFAFAAAALVGTVLSFGATTSPAQAAAPAFYEVQLAAPLDTAKTRVVNGVAWKCEDTTCRGSQGTSRPEVVCARLARKLGEVASFTAKGEPLDAEALAKCNGEKTATVARR